MSALDPFTGWCWHRWGNWQDEPAASGLTNLFGSALYQTRRCVRCNKAQQRNAQG